MMGAGGVMLSAPIIEGTAQIVKSGRGNTASGVTDTMQNAGNTTLALALPAAGLIIGGVIIERAASAAVR